MVSIERFLRDISQSAMYSRQCIESLSGVGTLSSTLCCLVQHRIYKLVYNLDACQLQRSICAVGWVDGSCKTGHKHKRESSDKGRCLDITQHLYTHLTLVSRLLQCSFVQCILAANLVENIHCVQKKKHPLTFSFISPWIICGFQQKLQWIYPRIDRFWQCKN